MQGSPPFVLLLLAQESSSDVTHVCFLEFVVFAAVSVDPDVYEGLDDLLKLESHVNEPIDQVLIVTMVSRDVEEMLQSV